MTTKWAQNTPLERDWISPGTMCRSPGPWGPGLMGEPPPPRPTPSSGLQPCSTLSPKQRRVGEIKSTGTFLLRSQWRKLATWPHWPPRRPELEFLTGHQCALVNSGTVRGRMDPGTPLSGKRHDAHLCDCRSRVNVITTETRPLKSPVQRTAWVSNGKEHG